MRAGRCASTSRAPAARRASASGSGDSARPAKPATSRVECCSPSPCPFRGIAHGGQYPVPHFQVAEICLPPPGAVGHPDGGARARPGRHRRSAAADGAERLADQPAPRQPAGPPRWNYPPLKTRDRKNLAAKRSWFSRRQRFDRPSPTASSALVGWPAAGEQSEGRGGREEEGLTLSSLLLLLLHHLAFPFRCSRSVPVLFPPLPDRDGNAET